MASSRSKRLPHAGQFFGHHRRRDCRELFLDGVNHEFLENHAEISIQKLGMERATTYFDLLVKADNGLEQKDILGTRIVFDELAVHERENVAKRQHDLPVIQRERLFCSTTINIGQRQLLEQKKDKKKQHAQSTV
jgi:hypothetical protein